MDPISLITLLIAVVVVMATGFAYFRSTAVKVWEDNAKAYKAEVDRLEQHIIRLEARIHELEARPDWSQVVEIMGATESHIIASVKEMYENHARTFKCPMQQP